MRTFAVILVTLVLVLPSAMAAIPTPGIETEEMDRFAYMSAGFDPGWEDLMDDVGPMATGSRAGTPPPIFVQNEIAKMVDNVSAEYLKDYLTTLVGFESRFYRSPHMLDNATPWLHDVLEGQGRLEVGYHNFTEDRGVWGFVTMSNVVLTLPGVNQSSDKVYYMYAHSDAMRTFDIDFGDPSWNDKLLNDTPGADDDGSGCVAILEAARVMSGYEFQDTIKFLMVQAEEIGLIGAARYVSMISAAGENVAGGIDYDMIGYSSGTNQYDLDLILNPASRDDGDYMVDVNDRYDIGLSIDITETTGSIPSDITRFYQAGYPSVMGIEYEFSPVYHTASDTVDVINFTLVKRATQMAVGTLAEWARMLYVDVGVTDDDMSVSNNKPVSDEEVTVEVNMTNIGNINATNMKVQFYADGIPFDSKRVWVEANGTNKTNATWTAVEGNHRISVELDPDNEIVETDETNNTADIFLYVNDRPRAVLTADPMVALTNDTIEFNGSFSSDMVGGVTSYNFTFGDGNGTGWISTPLATHAYPEDGDYVATLIVLDAEGAGSLPVEVLIQVLNRAPFADPFTNVTRTLTFNEIGFFANASDLDGVVTTHWEFGDGNSSDGVDPVHNYSKSGTYNILLEIEDDDGATASYPLRVIIDNRDPSCAILPNNVTGTIETEFYFDSNFSDLDGEIVAFEWDLGDGTITDTQVAYHEYARPGSYTVRLSVWDDDGAEARDSVDIEITDGPPVALGDALNFEGLTLKKITFLGHDSYDMEGPITFSWDFGDGNTSSLMDPLHAYWKPGEYTVSLTVFDSLGQNHTDVLPPIVVHNRPPKAAFGSFGNFTENGTVYFNGSGSSDQDGVITFAWDFGDGQTGEGMILGHVFPKAGKYQVNLTVTDDYGDSRTVSELVTVDPPPPPPPPPKKPKPQGEGSLLESQLFPVIILLIVALVIVLVWGARRGKKGDTPVERPQQQWEVPPPAEPPMESTTTTAPPEEPSPSDMPPEQPPEQPPERPPEMPVEEPETPPPTEDPPPGPPSQ